MSSSSSNPKYNLTDKIALVTGSSSGIGAATAIQLARNGAHLTIHGRSADSLQAVAQTIQQISPSGSVPLQILGDITDQSFVPKLIEETISHWGRLDILVNNAGASTTGGHLADGNLLETFDQMFNLNVRQVLQLTQLAVPHLEVTKGNIVNVSSVVGLRVYGINPIAYQASKAALDMATKCAALELGSRGIRVNSVNPGPVNTGFTRSVGYETFFQEHPEVVQSLVVLDRLAEPEDIAQNICFLACDEVAANITGSIMVNDAGMLIK